jgi:hypothetical protein
MAVQANNLLLLDASGLSRTIDTNNDSLSIGVKVALSSDLSVGGNLSVAGDIISQGSQNIVSGDSFIDLNNGQSNVTAKAGGIAVNVLAATASTSIVAFAAGTGGSADAAFALSTPTGASTYSVGDIIEISGCTEFAGNNGLFVVSAVENGKNADGSANGARTQVKVAGLSSAMPVNAPFAQNQFEAGAASSGVCKRVNLGVFAIADGSIMASGDVALTVGNFVSAYAASAWVGAGAAPGGRTKLYYESAQNVSLQEAYNVGPAIDMTAAIGAFDVEPAGGETVGFSIDGSSASNVSTTGADLTLSTLTSGNLVLNSVGNIDADAVAVTIDATGGISLDAAAASNFSVAGAGLTLATTASGDIDIASAGDIDADAANVYIDATAGIGLNAAANSEFNVTGANLNLKTLTSGTLAISSAGLLDVDAAANLDLDVTGTMDLLSSAAFSIDGTGASNLSATSGDLTVSTITSGNLVLSAAANIDADAVAVTVDASNGISLDAAAASNFSVAGAALTLETTGSGNVDINSAGDVTVDGAILSLDGTAASNFTVTGNSLTLSTVTSGEIALSSAGLLNIDAGANADVDVTGNFELDATGFISLAAGAASDVTVAGANLTLETTGSGDVILTSAGDLDFNGTDLDADLTGEFNVLAGGGLFLEGTGGGSITMNSGSFGITTTGTNNAYISAGQHLDLDATDNVTVDALNGFISLDAAQASNFTVTGNDLTLSTATNGDVLITSADLIEFSADKAKFAATPVEFGSHAGVSVVLGESISVGLVGCFQNASGSPKFYKAANNDASDDKRICVGVVQEVGNIGDSVLAASVPGTLVPMAFTSGPAAANIGQPVYLGTAGEVTLTAPTASGTTVFRVGYLASGSAVNGLYSVLFAPQFIAKRP